MSLVYEFVPLSRCRGCIQDLHRNKAFKVVMDILSGRGAEEGLYDLGFPMDKASQHEIMWPE